MPFCHISLLTYIIHLYPETLRVFDMYEVESSIVILIICGKWESRQAYAVARGISMHSFLAHLSHRLNVSIVILWCPPTISGLTLPLAIVAICY